MTDRSTEIQPTNKEFEVQSELGVEGYVMDKRLFSNTDSIMRAEGPIYSLHITI